MFEPWTETGSEYFVCQDNGLSQITKLFVSTREKKYLTRWNLMWYSEDQLTRETVHFWSLFVVQKRCMLELPNSLTHKDFVAVIHSPTNSWTVVSITSQSTVLSVNSQKKCIVCNFLLSWSEWHQHIVDKRIFQWSHCSVISLFGVHNNLLRYFWNRFPNPYLQLCLLVKNGRGMLSPLLILP